MKNTKYKSNNLSKYFLILTICVVFTIFVVGVESATYTESKEKLKQINNELDELAGKKKDILNQSSSLEKKIYSLEININNINAEIDKLEDKIKEKSVEIEKTSVEFESAKIQQKQQDELLQKRLRAMYKFGDYSYLEVLLNSTNLSDLMTNLDRVQLVLKSDREQLKKLDEYSKKVMVYGEKLEVEKKELEGYVSQNQAHLKDVVAKQKDLQSKKLQVATDLSAVGRAIDELEADSKRVTAMLKSMSVTRKFVGGKFAWPLPADKTYITSPFGYRIHPIYKTKKLHSGTDIGAGRGTPIYAALGGQVITARYLGGYGNCVMIDHGGGYVTVYGHASKLRCKQGQWVEQGDIVAEVGSTGASTGNHLHFEIRKNGDFTDPMNYFHMN